MHMVALDIRSDDYFFKALRVDDLGGGGGAYTGEDLICKHHKFIVDAGRYSVNIACACGGLGSPISCGGSWRSLEVRELFPKTISDNI